MVQDRAKYFRIIRITSATVLVILLHQVVEAAYLNKLDISWD